MNSSGAIIFEHTRRFSDTKKMPGGRVLSPNHINLLRMQEKGKNGGNNK